VLQINLLPTFNTDDGRPLSHPQEGLILSRATGNTAHRLFENFACIDHAKNLVGRFHGSNHMPTKIGPSGCSCKMPVNEEAMMAADMIGFMESVV
jgi:hypothetical protein